jgi:hypothetical protein
VWQLSRFRNPAWVTATFIYFCTLSRVGGDGLYAWVALTLFI